MKYDQDKFLRLHELCLDLFLRKVEPSAAELYSTV